MNNTNLKLPRIIQQTAAQTSKTDVEASTRMAIQSLQSQLSAVQAALTLLTITNSTNAAGGGYSTINTTTVSLTNKSGMARNAGDVVISNAAVDNSFLTTVAANDIKVIGVVAQDSVDGTAPAIAINAEGLVCTSGTSAVLVNADVAAILPGDRLAAHTTAGQAVKVANAFTQGVFAIALEAKASGVGTIDAIILPLQNRESIRYETLTPSDASTVTLTEAPYNDGGGLYYPACVIIDTDGGTISFPASMDTMPAGSRVCLTCTGAVITNSLADWTVGSNNLSVIYLPNSRAANENLYYFLAVITSFFSMSELERSAVVWTWATLTTTAKTLVGAINEVNTCTFMDMTAVSAHYTGFPNKTSLTVPSALSWVDGALGATRTLTLAPSGTTHKIYIEGVEYAIGTLTNKVDDVTGLYWFWITAPLGVPQLNSNVNHPGFDKCLVATVYWNTTTDKGVVADERHWMGRDQWMHEYLHETVGARWYTGGTLSPTNTTFSITQCEFYDEDLENILPLSTSCRVIYKNGSVNWEWDDNVTTLYKLNGATMRYNNANALADVPNNNHVAMWLFATNNITYPFMVLIGQRVDVTLANCRANNTPDSLVLGALPSAEMKLLYRVIFKQNVASVTYVEAADYRSVSNIPVSNYMATDHSVLAKLDYASSNHTGFASIEDTIAYMIALG